ncbi:hypothetical protein BGZ92_005380, partial [Podila epicladia]
MTKLEPVPMPNSKGVPWQPLGDPSNPSLNYPPYSSSYPGTAPPSNTRLPSSTSPTGPVMVNQNT